jgi:hypothetical protein
VEAVSIAMRWLHLASAIVLLGGIFYARVVAADLAPGFKPMAYGAIGAILASGLYNFLSETATSRNYQVWLGIKVLLALHVFAAVILYRETASPQKRRRSLTGMVISGALIVAIAGYLRWISSH